MLRIWVYFEKNETATMPFLQRTSLVPRVIFSEYEFSQVCIFASIIIIITIIIIIIIIIAITRSLQGMWSYSLLSFTGSSYPLFDFQNKKEFWWSIRYIRCSQFSPFGSLKSKNLLLSMQGNTQFPDCSLSGKPSPIVKNWGESRGPDL